MTAMPAGHRPQLVTIAEAAAVCEVWPDTVRRWLDRRQVTRYRIGTHVRVDLAECVATRTRLSHRGRQPSATVGITLGQRCA